MQKILVGERKILMSSETGLIRISYTLQSVKQMLRTCQIFSCEKPEGERLLLFHGIRTLLPCL